jgi:hypothetical protein
MNVLSMCVNLLNEERMVAEVKGFILLINNCKVNGEIIMFLLVNKLVDEIIWKYLKAISSQSKDTNNVLDE